MISALSRVVSQAFSSGDSESPQTSSVGATGTPEQPTGPNQTTMSTSVLAIAEGVDVRVTKLLIHPIKSCRGISVAESRFTPEGLLYDRQYVVVDAVTHKFITARQIPKMVLVETAIETRETPLLRVSFPETSGVGSFTTPLAPNPSVLETWELLPDVEVGEDQGLNAYVAQSSVPDGPSGSPSTLLSSYLGREILLVLKGPKRRITGPTSSHPDLAVDVRFQDAFPLLLATTESLAAVQEKVRLSASGVEGWKVGGITPQWQTDELVIERFRPNIVVSGSPAPFDEDYWGDVKIGDEDTEGGVVSLVKRCGRCLLPNVDTRTGVRDNAVPFKVITKFRRVEPEKGATACFGVNAVAQTSGVFRVGDRVKILSVLERETVQVREIPGVSLSNSS